VKTSIFEGFDKTTKFRNFDRFFLKFVLNKIDAYAATLPLTDRITLTQGTDTLPTDEKILNWMYTPDALVPGLESLQPGYKPGDEKKAKKIETAKTVGVETKGAEKKTAKSVINDTASGPTTPKIDGSIADEFDFGGDVGDDNIGGATNLEDELLGAQIDIAVDDNGGLDGNNNSMLNPFGEELDDGGFANPFGGDLIDTDALLAEEEAKNNAGDDENNVPYSRDLENLESMLEMGVAPEFEAMLAAEEKNNNSAAEDKKRGSEKTNATDGTVLEGNENAQQQSDEKNSEITKTEKTTAPTELKKAASSADIVGEVLVSASGSTDPLIMTKRRDEFNTIFL